MEVILFSQILLDKSRPCRQKRKFQNSNYIYTSKSNILHTWKVNEQLQVSLNYRCICLSYQIDYLNWHNRLFLANHSAGVYLLLHIWITQWIVKIWLWILIYNTINIAIKHCLTNDKTILKEQIPQLCYKNHRQVKTICRLLQK